MEILTIKCRKLGSWETLQEICSNKYYDDQILVPVYSVKNNYAQVLNSGAYRASMGI